MNESKYRYVFYTYKIIFLKGNLCGKYYLGKHKSRVPLSYSHIENIEEYAREHPDFDRYIGSGVIPTSYFQKYRPILNETYKKEIVNFYENNEQCLMAEKKLINNLFRTDDMCCNFAPGGQGHLVCKPTKEGTKIKISRTLRKYYKNHTQKWAGMHRTEENKEQISKTLKEYYATHQNNFLGRHHSESAKEKNRVAHKLLWDNKEYRENIISKSKEYWKTHTSPNLGTHLSEERKQHLHEINIGKPNFKNRGCGNGMFGKTPANARPVQKIDPNTMEVLETFESSDAAARCCGSKRGANIRKVIRGERKLAFGYYWKYKE